MCGRVGGCDVGADMGALGVWMGGAPSIDGLLAMLLIVLFILLLVMLLIVLFIMLFVMLIAVFVMLFTIFILLGVILRLLAFVRFFVFVVFLPFVVGFIGAISLVALGSGSRDGLSSGVIIGWCGLLARGAAKGSTWGCDADATGRQHMLNTKIEIK